MARFVEFTNPTDMSFRVNPDLVQALHTYEDVDGTVFTSIMLGKDHRLLAREDLATVASRLGQ